MKDYQAENNGYQVSVRNEKNEPILTEFDGIEPIPLREESAEIPYEKSVLKYRKGDLYGLIDYTGLEFVSYYILVQLGYCQLYLAHHIDHLHRKEF